ncbi:hypothetical protein P4S64_15120 [Vibrio sp. M60_M31a]
MSVIQKLVRRSINGITSDQFDWVSPFGLESYGLCYQMTADQQFKNSAKLRKQYFADMLLDPFWLDHDLGFQYSLSCVADYKLTRR